MRLATCPPGCQREPRRRPGQAIVGLLRGEAFRFLSAQMVTAALLARAVLLLVVPMGWGLEGAWWGIVTLVFIRAATLAFQYRRAFRPAPVDGN